MTIAFKLINYCDLEKDPTTDRAAHYNKQPLSNSEIDTAGQQITQISDNYITNKPHISDNYIPSICHYKIQFIFN